MKPINCFFDLEILRLIQPDSRYPHLEVCNGWKDFEGMGISCVGFAFDYGDSFAFPWMALPFTSLNPKHYKFIGFNCHSFDCNLLKANGIEIEAIDFLSIIRLAAFRSIDWRDTPPGYTYKLDALARANGIKPKNSRCDLAPVAWQLGNRKEVLDYCAHDVSILKELWNRFHSDGIIDPNDGKLLNIQVLNQQMWSTTNAVE